MLTAVEPQHWTKGEHGAMLWDDFGGPVIRLTCGGYAIILDEGRQVDLAEAEEIWVDGGWRRARLQ